MSPKKLQFLADLISDADKSITADLQPGCLTLKTSKNEMWNAFIIVAFLFALLMFVFYKRAEHNLTFGLIAFAFSAFKFWEIQSINKSIIIDTDNNSFSIIPNNLIYRWAMKNVYGIQPVFSLDKLPPLKITTYQKSKYDWTRRIYYKTGFWTVYVLEFDKEDVAKRVLDILTE